MPPKHDVRHDNTGKPYYMAQLFSYNNTYLFKGLSPNNNQIFFISSIIFITRRNDERKPDGIPIKRFSLIGRFIMRLRH